MPRRRPVALLSVLAAMAFLVPDTAGAAAPATEGTRTAALEYGYPHASAPDCVETPGVTTGCVRDVYRFYQGQCVSWVAHRLNTRSGVPMVNDVFHARHWGSAGTWAPIARSLHIPVNTTPAVGAVAWYGGHVAYVEQLNADGSLLVSEMNYDDHNAFRFVTIRKGFRWPRAFIHFRDLSRPTGTVRYRTDGTGTLWAYTLVGTRRTRSVAVGHGWASSGLVTTVDDVTGDGRPDLLARSNPTGRLFLYASTGAGRVGVARRIGSGWNRVTSLTDAGRLGGSTERTVAALGRDGTLRSLRLTRAGLSGLGTLGRDSRWRRVTGVGDATGDGRTDLVAVTRQGGAVLLAGSGPASVQAPRPAPGALARVALASA